jgi:DNA-binding GntR family transcriptional regulator
MRKGRCYNCGIYGHWGKECQKPPKKKDQREEAHLAKADTEQPALLLAAASAHTPEMSNTVYLNEQRVFTADYDNHDDDSVVEI